MTGAATTENAGDASMITPAMQAAIGQEAGRFMIEIDADLVRRLAEALDVDDPDLRAALERNEIGAEVPPWAILTHYGRLRPDRVPDAPLRGLQAADEFTILAPIRIGDRLTVVQRLADIQRAHRRTRGAFAVRPPRVVVHEPARRGRGADPPHARAFQGQAFR